MKTAPGFIENREGRDSASDAIPMHTFHERPTFNQPFLLLGRLAPS